jgi:AcrR family transcriptional regulator
MPRTREQNKLILDQRKQEIISCSITMFKDRDGKDVSIDDICKKLGISHGLFYHYFKNKKDLLLTIGKYSEIQIIEPLKKITKQYVEHDFFMHFFNFIYKLIKNSDLFDLFELLNDENKCLILNEVCPDFPLLNKLYSSSFNKNLRLLNDQGCLSQSLESTYKTLILIINGLIFSVKKNGELPTAKSILKTIIK